MRSQTKKNNQVQRIIFAAVLFFPHSIYALEALSEQEMGKVQGRDGVTIGLNVPQTGAITAEQIRWELDNGEVDANTDSLQNHLVIGGTEGDASQFVIKPIDLDGSAASHDLNFALAIDSYTNAEGRAGLGLDATWNRMRVQMDGLTVVPDGESMTSPGRSFGSMALDAGGRFAVFGDGGFANSSAAADQARVIVNVGDIDNSDPDPNNWTMANPGRMFYRMGAAGSTEIQMDNLGFLFDMHQGTVGVDSDGLVVRSAPGSRTDLNLTFDIHANVANTATNAFQFNAQSIPMLLFGWRGGIEDFDLELLPQGTWLPDDGAFTQGLTASLGFDLADNFQFVIGEAKYEESGNEKQSYLEFTQPISIPTSLGQSRKDVEFGYLTLDTVSANHQGIGGICYGGANSYGSSPSSCTSATGDALPTQLIEAPASDTGLAIVTRDWGLHAYSSRVVYRDGVSAANDIDEGWALIYTLGDISSNWYLYPQAGDGTEGSPGLTMDLVTAIQTEGGADANGRPDRMRWENGTHLMIGDTDFQTSYHDTGNPTADGLAIGLMGADLLFATKEMDVGLSLSDGLNLSSNKVRLQLRGLFGGGDVPRMEAPVYGSYIDMNLESDEFVFKLFPALNGDAINFGGFVSLTNLNEANFSNDTGGGHGHDDGSYISFAEPNLNKLNVDVRLADISGDIEIPSEFILSGAGGKIDLLTATGEADGKPKLRIENNMNVGTLACKPGSRSGGTCSPGGEGDPLMIGRIEFGGKDLGSMIVPAAKIYTSVTLEQQNAP